MHNQHTYSTESDSQPYDHSKTNDESITSWEKMLEFNDEEDNSNMLTNTNGGNLFHGTSPDKKLTENTIGSYQKQKLSTSFLEEKKLQLVIPPRDEATNIANFTSPSKLINPNTPTTPNSALVRHLPPSQPRSLLQIHFKTGSFSNVVSQQSTALKAKPQTPNDTYKQLSETNTPVRYSPSQNHSPNHSPSLNTFILPPFVDKTNFSVSTCNLLPQPFISSSYSRSQNISSPNVESPSFLYSNASMIKPFTFHFIKQKSKDIFPNNSSLNTSNNEEIQRLEFIYKKRSELLASQLLIPKMEQFFRGLVSQIQELLLSAVQIKSEENEMKRLDQIQHLLYVKKFLLTYISDIEKFTIFLNAPNMKSSNDDLKYLEDIEKTLNYFKHFKTGEDIKYQNWRGNRNEFFQYIAQLSASFCICCGKPLPPLLQKCMSYFPVNHLNSDELLKRVKHEDQKTLNSNKFLTFTNNFTQIKKETYDIEATEAFQDFSNSDFFEYD